MNEIPTEAQLADGDAIIANCEIILISEVSGIGRIQVDKRRDLFPAAVFVDSIRIMGGVQKEFFNPEFRKICLHCKKGMQE